jgi:uncharacterized protein YbaP (TraB family)
MRGKRFSWHHVMFLAIALKIHCGGASQGGRDNGVQAETKPREPQQNSSSAKPNTTGRQPGAKPSEKVFLWKIESLISSDKTIYLLGSVHMGNASFYPLDPVIEEAYRKSEVLAVEVNTVAVPLAKAMEVVFSHAKLPPGEKIYTSLSAKVWNKLILALEKYQVPVETVLNLKPWFAAITLSILRVVEQGYSTDFGIDKYFVKKGDKPIIELESINYQLGLFDGMSAELQELLLLDAIEGSLQSGGDLEEAVKAWREGDAQAMNYAMFKDLNEHPEFRPIYKRLIIDRNYGMAEGIEAALINHDALFVVVGAGHIVGDEGLAAIFEKKGYKVRQLEKR